MKFRYFQITHFLMLFVLLNFFSPQPGLAFDENSPGYYLASTEYQIQNPDRILTGKKPKISDAAVREYNWIIDTLRHRCTNEEQILVSTLVAAWRITKSRGYDVTLLALSRELVEFSGMAFQSRRNQKFDFQKAVLKWLKTKYPEKK